MAAPDSAAADEFAALQRSQISHLSHHPADSSISDSSDIDSDTSASNQTYRQTQPSLRFGNSRRRNNNVVHDEDDEDDDWDARYGGTSVFTKTGKGYEIPKGDAGRIEGNTGPKGVIADARAAEKEKFELELRKRREKSGVLGTGTHVRSEIDEEVGRKWYEDESEHEDEDEDQDEDGDESFMKEWRRKRMSEVEALARNGSRGGGSGKIEMVDALGYLEAVDGAARGRVVVVYISDSEVGVAPFYSLFDKLVLPIPFPLDVLF